MGLSWLTRQDEKLALMVLQAETVDIRDVDGGQEPFLYASGNWGPGYVSIKNLVGRKLIIKYLTHELAKYVAEEAPQVEFVAGNVTGGVIPGWLLGEYLELLLFRPVPFVYIRDMRKKGGQKELITGIANNPEIRPGANGLIVEELVNFAETICNGAEALRGSGYEVTHGACILSYENPEASKALAASGIDLVSLFCLREFLAIAEEHRIYPKKLIDCYREFLQDPLGWQAKRGLQSVKEGGTK